VRVNKEILNKGRKGNFILFITPEGDKIAFFPGKYCNIVKYFNLMHVLAVYAKYNFNQSTHALLFG